MSHLVLKINDTDQIFENWAFVFAGIFNFPVANMPTCSAGKAKHGKPSLQIKQLSLYICWGFGPILSSDFQSLQLKVLISDREMKMLNSTAFYIYGLLLGVKHDRCLG